jgi:hypothetical protein
MRFIYFVLSLYASSVAADRVEVVFWVNAFIPLSFEGVTRAWPNHPGKTMVKAPVPLIGCFATDQRGFNASRKASARMHTEVRAVLDPVIGFSMTQSNYCGVTTKIDCDTGAILDTATAKIQGEFRTQYIKTLYGTPSLVNISYTFRARDPLVPQPAGAVAPFINYEGWFNINPGRSIELHSEIDDFPSFEAYVIVNKGRPQPLMRINPKSGSNLSSLAGCVTREFDTEIKI